MGQVWGEAEAETGNAKSERRDKTHRARGLEISPNPWKS